MFPADVEFDFVVKLRDTLQFGRSGWDVPMALHLNIFTVFLDTIFNILLLSVHFVSFDFSCYGFIHLNRLNIFFLFLTFHFWICRTRVEFTTNISLSLSLCWKSWKPEHTEEEHPTVITIHLFISFSFVRVLLLVIDVLSVQKLKTL